MKKSLLLAVTLLGVFFLFWILKPLKSRIWDIEFDADLQDGKDRYLDTAASGPFTAGRPNVIVIMADDLGMTDISLYGSPYVDTPNIDSIGSGGITFSHAYATAPICSPSRAGLLTGRYQNRFGFESQPMNRYARNILEYWITKKFVDTEPMYLVDMASTPGKKQIERQGVPPTEILLSEALTAAGYRSDIVGKWHLGYGELQHPINRGFDSFFGFIEAYSYFIDPDLPGVESWQFEEFSEKYIWKQQRKAYSAVQIDGRPVEEEAHLTDAFAREAVDRIDRAAGGGEPFFLYLPFSAPHTPFQALAKYTSRFADVTDPRKRIYYAMIAQLDDAVGSVLEALDRGGLRDNTIVVFTSDNGGATYTGATGNDPLRGGKMSHFEGGLSVPLMMQWPSKIKGGITEDHPVMLFDLYTTILSAAGVPLPEDRLVDGIDLLDQEAVKSADSRPLFWRSDYNQIVLFQGWKLIMNRKDGRVWLYNLDNDREETRNLAGEHPEIISRLEAMFREWSGGMMDAAWPRVMDYYYNEEGEGYWFAT